MGRGSAGLPVETKARAVGRLGGLGHQHIVSTQPAVDIRQSKAHTAAAGRTGPRASAIPLTALSQEKLGAGVGPAAQPPGSWHRELTSMTRADSANTAT